MAVTDYTGSILEGRYRVIRLLGRGGMGAVYLGEHVVIGKRVAIKFLHAHFVRDETIVERFYREARATAAIAHRHIVDVLDVGVSPKGDPYFVMAYLEGESLLGLLKRVGPMNLAAACGVMEPLLLALGAAHSKGIVHRDLKPENIFLVYHPGEPPEVKLIDFGVSKIIGDSGPLRITRTGALLGTPAYMSPEQARGDANVDHLTDLYAVGVILYEMLSAKVPFGSKQLNAYLPGTMLSAPILPREAFPGFPEEAEPIVMKALSRNPAERHESAAKLLERLRALPCFPCRVEQLVRLTGSPAEMSFAMGDLGRKINDPPVGTGSPQIRGRHTPANPTPISAISIAVSRRYRLGLALTATGLVTIGVVILVIIFSQDRARNAAMVPLVPAFNPPAARPAMSKSVKIGVLGAPEHARISYDGKPIRGNPFVVPTSTTAVFIEVTAEGFAPFVSRLVPSKDRMVMVTMKPIARGGNGAVGASSPKSEKGFDATGPGDPAAAAAETAFENGNRGTRINRRFESDPVPTISKKTLDKGEKQTDEKRGITYGTRFE